MNDVNQKEEIQTINEFVMLCGALILANSCHQQESKCCLAAL